MTTLATLDDLANTLGRSLTDAEAARAETLLEQASALVQRYTKRQFIVTTDDTVVVQAVDGAIRLPQSPVTAVASVRMYTGLPSAPLMPAGTWRWDGGGRIYVDGGLDPNVWVSLPEDLSGQVLGYQVTYSHGHADVPADVKAVVAAMVLRTLLSPSQMSGLVSEKIGAYSYVAQSATGTVGSVVTMTAADREALSDYRPKLGMITMGAL